MQTKHQAEPREAGMTPLENGPAHERRWPRRLMIALGVIVAVLVVLQVVVSPIAKTVINRKLAALPGYTGHLDGLRIALWRGAVVASDFVLYERGHEDDLPVVNIRHMSTRIAWAPLFQGRLGGQVVVDGCESNAVKRENVTPQEVAKKVGEKVDQAKEKAEPWRDVLRRSFPIEISRLDVKNAKVRFVDRSHQPNVDVALDNLTMIATGLRTRQDGEDLPAKVQLTGNLTGNGKLKVDVQADPLAKPPHFRSTMELTGLSLPALNPLLLAYANADVGKGSFDFFLDVTAEKGGYQGYTKPFFRDLDFKTPSDEGKPLRKLAKSAANAVTSVLKSDDEQKVATKAPFSGTFDQNQVDVWTTVSNLLRNAFIQALREGFDRGGSPGKKDGK